MNGKAGKIFLPIWLFYHLDPEWESLWPEVGLNLSGAKSSLEFYGKYRK